MRIRESLVLGAVLGIGVATLSHAASDVPTQTSDFLAYCQADYQGCKDQVTSIAVTLIMTGNADFCDPPNDYPDDLTQLVIAWLTAHHETHGEAVSKSLVAALIAVRPCSRH